MISQDERQLLDYLKKQFKTYSNSGTRTFVKTNLKKAAVLIPFAFHQDELVVLFTKRTDTVNSHCGQVSFPGGLIEKNDLNPLSAALRETCEEIGIPLSFIEIIGSLQPFDTSTGFYIFPFIGYIAKLNDIHKNNDEVERIFCIPYKWLRNPENLNQEDYINPSGSKRKVWAFSNYDGERVWGITAVIMKKLLEKTSKNERGESLAHF